MAKGWAITDPNKLTVLTPGFSDATEDRYDDFGIPAPVVAEYLRENRIVPEKNDLNSLLFLLTPGVESSKAGTLLSHLVTFKKLHDENRPLDDVFPGFVQRRPARYAGVGLRDLCAEMHAFYRAARTSALQEAQFRAEHLPEMVMHPHEATRELVRNNVDYVPLGRDRGPDRGHALARLSSGNRHHRAGRTGGRPGAADDRLSQGLRTGSQSLPGLRIRGAGPLS